MLSPAERSEGAGRFPRAGRRRRLLRRFRWSGTLFRLRVQTEQRGEGRGEAPKNLERRTGLSLAGKEFPFKLGGKGPDAVWREVALSQSEYLEKGRDSMNSYIAGLVNSGNRERRSHLGHNQKNLEGWGHRGGSKY